MGKYFGYALLVVLIGAELSAQNKIVVELNWLEEDRRFETVDGIEKIVPTFEGAHHDGDSEFLPRYLAVLDIPSRSRITWVDILPLSFKDGQSAGISVEAIEALRWNVREERGKLKLVLDFLPVSQTDGSFIESFEINYRTSPDYSRMKSNDYVNSSVLASGDWYRIGVTEDGIYRLGKDELEQLGVDVSSLNPSSLNIYGNGFGQLPYDNGIERPDDLLANSILVEGESDGIFDDEDYILFYAKGPDTWSYDSESGLYDHHKHEYSDTSYYFIGINTGNPSKRILTVPSAASATQDVTGFDEYAFHRLFVFKVDGEYRKNSLKSWKIK